MRASLDPTRTRWFLWGTLAVAFLLVNVYRLSSAVLSEELMVAFDTTGAELGTLHAAFFYVYAPMQIPAGVLADRAGPRYAATVGAVVMNLGALWFAFAGSYTSGLLARALIGLGGSVIFVSILRFCANWFRADEFATMNGITVAVAGVGGIVATTPLAVAITTFGWRSTLGLLGTLGLSVAVLVFVLVRDSPERAGLAPIEGVPRQTKLSLREVRVHAAGVFRDRYTWVIGLMVFCTTGTNLTLVGLWGVP